MYRFLSRRVDVFLPTQLDCPATRIEVSTQYTFSEFEVEGTFRELQRRVRWPPAGRTGIGKRQLSRDQELELSRRLKADEPPNIFDDLMLEALELSEIHDDHRLALVTAGTAFETYLQIRLATEYQARGITVLPGKGKT